MTLVDWTFALIVVTIGTALIGALGFLVDLLADILFYLFLILRPYVARLWKALTFWWGRTQEEPSCWE